MHRILAAVSLFAVAACGLNGTDRYKDDEETAQATPVTNDVGYATYGEDNLADTMASNDNASMGTDGTAGDTNIPDPEDRPIMQAQVVLDRQGFGPGVIDGKMGMSTENALQGFQEANDLDVTGELDEATKAKLAQWDTIPATRVVTIPAEWGRAQYHEIPDDTAEKAKMKRLGYSSLDERLAERFHTTVAVLKTLNPGGMPAGMENAPAANGRTPATASASPASAPTPTSSASDGGSSMKAGAQSFFSAGRQIRVPNIGGDRIAPGSVKDGDWQRTLASLGVGSEQPKVAKIVVSKSEDTLKAFDQSGKLVAEFTVSSGSSHDPLPIGNWEVTGVGHNPTFSFDPDLMWDVPDSEAKQQLPPGPNGPVGVVWIDLSKEHYGIHGTPEPETIGRAQSHGCVRLTNWDAARLAQMVSTSTKVVFEK